MISWTRSSPRAFHGSRPMLVDLFDRVEVTAIWPVEGVNHEASEFSGEMRRLHLDPPEIDSTELPGYWPPRKPGGRFNGLASAFAQTMMMPQPHPGGRWGEPENQQQRRAVAEKENAQMAAYHEQATSDEEDRLNREERERFAASRRAT